jgi:hypothetical protein
MAEPQEPQLLSAFNTEAITSLKGAINPESVSAITKEFLVRAQQYPTLRMLLDDKDVKRKIGEALVKNDPTLLREILLEIFNEARTFERQEMTELPGAEPFMGEPTAAPTLNTQESVARIAEAETTSQLVIEQRKIAKRHEFAKKLTDNFVKQSHKQITEERKQAEIKRVERDLLSPGWYTNKEQIANTLRQSSLADFSDPKDQKAMVKVAKIATREAGLVAKEEGRFEKVIAAAASSVAADEAVVKRPDVYIKIAADQAERSSVPADRIIERAATLENATVGFTENEEYLPLQMSALAKTPAQKIVAGVVDALPEGPREAIIAGVVGGAWEKAIDTATRYYGQQVVNEGWFQQALTHGNQGLSNKKNALQSITSGVQRVIGDVAVTVFRGEMDEATVGYIETIRQHAAVPLFAYLENIRQHAAVPTMASAVFREPVGGAAVSPAGIKPPVVGAGPVGAPVAPPTGMKPPPIATVPVGGVVVSPPGIQPPVVGAGPVGGAAITQTEIVQQYIIITGPVSYQQFYAAAVYSHNPGVLSSGLSLGLQYGTRKAKRALTKAVANQVAKKAATTAITEGGAAIGGAAAGTALAPGVGTLIGLAVGFLWDAATGLFKKAIGLFKSLVGMGTSGAPEDNLLYVVVGVVVLIFFLPLFPLLNIPAFNQSMIDTSIATAVGDGDNGPGGPEVTGAPEGEVVIWAYSGNAPVTDITSSSQLGCPVHGGTITQGPNGSFSHQGIQAYDFANSMGSPIYATHDAYVVSFHDGIPPYTFINHSYGNYVLLVGQLPSGSKFFTIYGHMLSVDPIVQEAISGTRSSPCKNNDTKLVCKGEIIGYEDATGSTWGTQPGNGIHLHYQSQGLGSLILPPGCP